MLFVQVIKGTPMYVWLILLFLIQRGIRSAKDGIVSYPKMLVVPLIFIVWGLEKLFMDFHYLLLPLVLYLLLACVGTAVGYALYAKYRKMYMKNNILYRTGTYLPLTIMLINFVVKYLSNVGLSINPALYDNLPFSMFYSLICGFSVGLFIGGIWQAYTAGFACKRSALSR